MRFLVRFVLTLLLLASLGLFALYAATPYPAFAARITAPNYGLEPGQRFSLTLGRYAALRLGLAATAGAAAVGLVASRGRGRRGRRPARRGRPRPRLALSRGERTLAAALLLSAAAVYGWFAFYYPPTLDELASYSFSVLPGPALTASYYPFPNNHLLPNLLVGLVHGLWLGADPLVALRLLPTLLGLALLPLGYGLLLRYLPFGVATLGWGLFVLSPLPAFYAVAGRGYGWALAALLAGLWASLQLLRPQPLGRAGRQQAWVVFGTSAVLGLYAVPTHLYGLLGLGLGLLVGFGRWRGRRRCLNLLHLAVLALGGGLTVAVLYAPVVAVSGWPALVANRYVLRLAAADFWAHLGPYYLLGTASELLGRGAVSACLFGAVAVLAPLGLWRGQLTEPARRLGWLLVTQLLLWLPLVLAQRVYPPARTLLVVLLALFVLAALLGQVALRAGWPGRVGRVGEPTSGSMLAGIALVLSSYAGYRLQREYAVIAQLRHEQVVLQRAYVWLRAQAPRRVWTDSRRYALFWQYDALRANQPPLPLGVVEELLPGRPGEYGVYTGALGAHNGAHKGQSVRYAEEQVTILSVGPAATGGTH